MPGVRISVFAQPDPVLEDGLRQLRRSRAEVAHVWPPTKRISPGMDILICDFFPGIAEAIPWEPGEAEAALVILLPQGEGYDANEVSGAAPQAVVQRPFTGRALLTSTQVAWSLFRYEQRLRDRISRLDENLRSIRYIERAKLALMKSKNLEEADAYRQLRDTAMSQRVSIVEVAEAILRQKELGI